MTDFRAFDNYMKTHLKGKGTNNEQTNTRIGDKELSIFGGSYVIQEEEYPDFLKMYAKNVFEGGKEEYLTEKQNGNAIAVDIDFRHSFDTTSRQYTYEHIENLVYTYTNELKQMLNMTGNCEFNVFVMEKPEINRIADKQIVKDGIHLIFGLKLPHKIQVLLRERVMKKVLETELFTGIPLTNSIEDVFDLAIPTGKNNWQLYGSKKPNHSRYELTQIFHFENDPVDNEFMTTKIPLQDFNIAENIYKLSVRCHENPSFELRQSFLNTIPQEVAKEAVNKKTRVKNGDINNYDRIYFERFMEEGLLDNYSKKYETWRNIGFILKNEFKEEGWELFKEFSALDPERGEFDASRELECREHWDKWEEKPAKPLGIGTLISMVRKDHKEKYIEIHKEINNLKAKEKKESTNENNESFWKNVFNRICPEFEKDHAKIVNNSSYVKILPNRIIVMSRSQLTSAYEHMQCGVSSFGVPVGFIGKWIGFNDAIRKYDDLDIYPDESKCPPNVLNTWRPFKTELLRGEYTKHTEGLAFMLKHIHILCDNDKVVSDYMIKWFAQMIQYPAVKTINPVLISKQGAGKGSLIDWGRKMLGADKVIETTRPSRDVWGDFNGAMVNAFLVNLDELSKKEQENAEGQIKGLITNPTLWINTKGVNQYQIKSYHRFITTTNSADPVKTSEDDRRNLIIASSNELIGNKEYFDKMYEYLADENVIRTCYDYLKSIPDMENFHKIPVPKTEYHNELKQSNRSVPDLWLEDFTRANLGKTTVELSGKEIYDNFADWCSENNYKFDTTPLKFGVLLTNMKVNGICKGNHTRLGKSKIFNIELLKQNYNLGCLINI